MNKSVIRGFGALALTLALTGTSFAQSSGTTVEETSSLADSFGLSYWSETLAAPVSSPLDGDSVDKYGTGDGAGWVMYNSISAGYKLTPKSQVYINPRYDVRWTRGFDVTALDMRAGYKNGELFKGDGFNISGSFLTYLPTTLASRKEGLFFKPRVFLDINAPIQNSRFTFGSYLVNINYFYTSETEGKTAWAWGILPYANYKFSPSVSATLELDYEASSQYGDFFNLNRDNTYVRTYLNVTAIEKYLNISPFAEVQTQEVVNSDSARWGFVLSSSIL